MTPGSIPSGDTVTGQLRIGEWWFRVPKARGDSEGPEGVGRYSLAAAPQTQTKAALLPVGFFKAVLRDALLNARMRGAIGIAGMVSRAAMQVRTHALRDRIAASNCMSGLAYGW
jgi:hypothetical protein